MRVIYLLVRIVAAIIIGIGRLFYFIFYQQYGLLMNAWRKSNYYEQRILLTTIIVLDCAFWTALVPVGLSILTSHWEWLVLLMMAPAAVIPALNGMDIGHFHKRTNKLRWYPMIEPRRKNIRYAKVNEDDPDYRAAWKELNQYLGKTRIVRQSRAAGR